jgi:hypothetical protein
VSQGRRCKEGFVWQGGVVLLLGWLSLSVSTSGVGIVVACQLSWFLLWYCQPAHSAPKHSASCTHNPRSPASCLTSYPTYTPLPAGGLLSGALFQYPGAVIMTAIGVAFASALRDPAGWLSGFIMGVSAVGVALVSVGGRAVSGWEWERVGVGVALVSVGGLCGSGWEWVGRWKWVGGVGAWEWVAGSVEEQVLWLGRECLRYVWEGEHVASFLGRQVC